MNISGECSGGTRSLDLDLDRRVPISEPGDPEEDKEIASQAVLLVMAGARRGAVHLCARIAELMRENKRLQRTIEAQKSLIEQLRSRCPQTGSTSSPQPPPSPSPSLRLPPLPLSGFHLPPPSPPPPPASSSPSFSFYLPSPSASSYSSGRGSLPSAATPPCLPRLTATPHPHPPIAPRKQQPLSLPCSEGNELPIMPHPPPAGQRSDVGARPQQHDGTSGERVRKPGGRDKRSISSGYGATSSKTQRILKKRERFLKRTTACGAPLGGKKEDWKEDDGEDKDLEEATSQAELLHPSTTRKKHRLKLNDRVVLETRQGQEEEEEWEEEKKRGAVRFIGPLENSDSTDVYIGVELDTPCGDNDGCINGHRYFKCEHNHGTFTTITDVRKLPSVSALPTDGNTPEPSPASPDRVKASLPKKLLVGSEEGRSECRDGE